MAFLFTKNLTADEFVQFVKEKQQGKTGIIELSGFEIEGFDFPFEILKDVHFKDSKWSDIEAKGRVFENVIFEDCELENLNFREVVFKNAVFKNCTLTNVVMNKSKIDKILFENSKLSSTDSNIEHSYRELVADTLRFKNTELENINFFESKGKFYFDGGKLFDVSGMGLKQGSALYFHNTTAIDIDFGDSSLSTLEVKNSTIKESKANNCRIGSVVLEDSTLDFPIADGKGYGTVTAKNTGNVVIGGISQANEVTISDCSQLRIIHVGGMTFDKIVISNCNPSELIFYKSKGKSMTISNVTVFDMDFRMADIDHLILENIHVRADLKYDGAKIGKLETTGITFDSDINIRAEGANIELKPEVFKPSE